MPLYEYHCEDCEGIFELLRPVREASDPQPCPVCDHDSKRLMTTDFSAFVMRGGMPRRIPDKGLHWTLKGQTTEPERGQDMDEFLVPFDKKPRESAALTEDEKSAPPPATEPEVRIRKKRSKTTATKRRAAAKSDTASKDAT